MLSWIHRFQNNWKHRYLVLLTLTTTVDFGARWWHLLILALVSLEYGFHLPSPSFQNHCFLAYEIFNPSVFMSDDDISTSLFLKYLPFVTCKTCLGFQTFSVFFSNFSYLTGLHVLSRSTWNKIKLLLLKNL